VVVREKDEFIMVFPLNPAPCIGPDVAAQ